MIMTMSPNAIWFTATPCPYTAETMWRLLASLHEHKIDCNIGEKEFGVTSGEEKST